MTEGTVESRMGGIIMIRAKELKGRMITYTGTSTWFLALPSGQVFGGVIQSNL